MNGDALTRALLATMFCTGVWLMCRGSLKTNARVRAAVREGRAPTRYGVHISHDGRFISLTYYDKDSNKTVTVGFQDTHYILAHSSTDPVKQAQALKRRMEAELWLKEQDEDCARKAAWAVKEESK
jgi:hypothetical protein